MTAVDEPLTPVAERELARLERDAFAVGLGVKDQAIAEYGGPESNHGLDDARLGKTGPAGNRVGTGYHWNQVRHRTNAEPGDTTGGLLCREPAGCKRDEKDAANQMEPSDRDAARSVSVARRKSRLRRAMVSRLISLGHAS